MTDITPIEYAAIQGLRRRGYAIALFNPDELRDADFLAVQDAMVVAGGDAIEILSPAEDDEEY